jgi:hypothetical protein
MLVNLGIFVGAPYGLEAYGVIAPLAPNGIFVLGVAGLGVLVITLLNETATGTFDFNRQGLDYCKVAFGAALSSLAVQVTHFDDPKQKLPSGLLSGFIAKIIHNTAGQKLALYSLAALIALGIMWWVGGNSRAIQNETAKGAAPLALLNYLLGSMMYVMYVAILIVKG